MLGFVLFVILLLVYSYLFGSPEKSNRQSTVNHPQIFPEDVFQLLDDEPKTAEPSAIYDPWTDESLGISTPSKTVSVKIAKQPILLLPPAETASDLPLTNLLKKQKIQKLKMACSLLKKHGFISKTQKLSGKGVTKAKLLQYLENALADRNANLLLAGYLKVS